MISLLSTWSYLWSKLRNEKVRLDPQLRQVLLDLVRPLKPMRAVGVKKVRVGDSRDGGYVMLDDFGEITGAYSFGVGHDVSWDQSLAERGIAIFQFDHTVFGPPMKHALFRFQPIRLGVEPGRQPLTDTLAHLVETNSTPGQDLILKVDIEEDEWEVFAVVAPEILKSFRQIVCEFHAFHKVADPVWRQRAIRTFACLTQYHQVVHLHRNSIMPFVITDEVQVPMVMEITFARKDSYRFSEIQESFPGPLDKSTSRIFPDQPLDFLKYL
jgi:hypothetical protein